jgi:hypothetical protein
MEASNEIVSRIMVVAALFVFFCISGLSDTKAMWIYALVDLFSAVVVLGNNRQECRVSLKLTSTFRKDDRFNGWSMFAGTLIGGAIFRVSPLILASQSTSGQVAAFAMGGRIVELALLPVGLYVGLTVGELSKHSPRDSLKLEVPRWVLFSLLTTIVIALGAGLLPVFAGSEYKKLTGDIRWVVATLTPHTLAMISSGVLFTRDLRRFLRFNVVFSIPIYACMLLLSSHIGTNSFVIGSWAGLFVAGLYLVAIG